MAVILAGLNERKRELAILRSIGAGARDLLFLLMSEGLLIILTGIVVGVIFLHIVLFLLGNFIISNYGIAIAVFSYPTGRELFLLFNILFFGLGASLIPALRVYGMTLRDGLDNK
jgi:putative ABC transport system permease protein